MMISAKEAMAMTGQSRNLEVEKILAKIESDIKTTASWGQTHCQVYLVGTSVRARAEVIRKLYDYGYQVYASGQSFTICWEPDNEE